MTFINKYRPIHFKDYENDKAELITTIQYLIKTNVVNVLFIGCSNSGKSVFLESCIREYVAKYNLLEASHVLRLNNIKEQGIQYFRNDLRFFCQNIPAKGVKKLVVIDDIDLIAEQGQQILANCVDKYSESTNFMASCTNTHKIINQIQTSLLTLTIPKVSSDLQQRLFYKIIKLENLSFTEDSKAFLLKMTPNIKNMLNNLQKCSLYSSDIIDIDSLTKLICNINNVQFDQFTCYLQAGDLIGASELLLSLFESGYSVIDILDAYFSYVSLTNLYTDKQKYEIVKVITYFTTIFHTIHEDSIELPLFVNSLLIIFVTS